MAKVLLTMIFAAALAAQSPYDVAAPPPAGFDRQAAQRETERLLSDLIRLDTQNPPGNEMLVARHLESVLRGVPGIEMRLLEVGRNRANFLARLRAARPAKKPVLVMGHMDVVGAELSKWTTPPFTPAILDNYLYGRGAIDDKGMLAATVIALLRLAEHREALDRDIIFLATAAEEGGDEGIEWVIKNHFDLLKEAEFALNEGGRTRIRDGRIQSVNIQTTEKLSYMVKATARGAGGHASIPLPGNALAALARATGRVHEWKPPVRLIPTTRLYFERLGMIETDPAMKQAMENIPSELAAEVLSREPLHNAMLRTGLALTLIGGGIRGNVIPSEGTATFNVRILPGEDIREIVREMNCIGGESQVVFELQGPLQEAPPASPVNTALFLAMEAAARIMAPSAVVIPFLSTGASDSAALRARGIPTYGILPLPLIVEDELRMHGDNERVPLLALGWGAEYMYRVLWAVASR